MGHLHHVLCLNVGLKIWTLFLGGPGECRARGCPRSIYTGAMRQCPGVNQQSNTHTLTLTHALTPHHSSQTAPFLAPLLQVPEGAVVPTVMKQIFEGLAVGMVGGRGTRRKVCFKVSYEQ